MTKIFYDHLIIIEEITAVLDAHSLSENDKKNFLDLMDQTMHHHILDTILTHLPKIHQKTFLIKLHDSPSNPALMSFLKEHTTVDIEKAIFIRANSVKNKLLKEIEKASR